MEKRNSIKPPNAAIDNELKGENEEDCANNDESKNHENSNYVNSNHGRKHEKSKNHYLNTYSDKDKASNMDQSINKKNSLDDREMKRNKYVKILIK